MTESRKISVLSSARLHGVTMAIVGLLFGVGYSVGGALWELITNDLNRGTALAFLALIGMPAIFGVFGVVAGTVGTVIYNLVVERIGGIAIGFER